MRPNKQSIDPGVGPNFVAIASSGGPSSSSCFCSGPKARPKFLAVTTQGDPRGGVQVWQWQQVLLTSGDSRHFATASPGGGSGKNINLGPRVRLFFLVQNTSTREKQPWQQLRPQGEA